MKMDFLKKLFKPLSLELHKILREKHDITFMIRDYGQIKPYSLTQDEISNLEIIDNINPRDAYIIGFSSCLASAEKYQYETLSVTQSGELILKTATDCEDSTLHCSLEKLTTTKQDYLDHCSAQLTKDLILHAYEKGRSKGMVQHQEMMNTELKQHKEVTEIKSNVLHLSRSHA